ncbi:MAG: winged helix-turn-helix domain-containing protein [Candidatus Roseilinea sp.]|uniref:winged helix-turn-helix domain-containing protein n=1 Tax=Candidatus Roseilinea sp. TaxID=2838777 RepID=UPI00404B976C
MRQASDNVLLVAEVQAGAIALLSLLKEQHGTLPATILYDKEGRDINIAIRALQLGVREYLLSTDSEAHRELSTRLMAERINNQPQTVKFSQSDALRYAAASFDQATTSSEFRWDPATHLIQNGQHYVRLSPIEGRIFDLLYTHRGKVVSVTDLLQHALTKSGADAREGAKHLRPHVVRLRTKLEQHPGLNCHIVNLRGSGYMLI